MSKDKTSKSIFRANFKDRFQHWLQWRHYLWYAYGDDGDSKLCFMKAMIVAGMMILYTPLYDKYNIGRWWDANNKPKPIFTTQNKTVELPLPIDKGEVSDGHHTFNQLYEHRELVFINLVHFYPDIAYKTRLNDKKEKWHGWFILALNTKYGQITYHLPEKYWNIVQVKEVNYNFDYDGHTPKDVTDRLMELIENF